MTRCERCAFPTSDLYRAKARPDKTWFVCRRCFGVLKDDHGSCVACGRPTGPIDMTLDGPVCESCLRSTLHVQLPCAWRNTDREALTDEQVSECQCVRCRDWIKQRTEAA